MGIGVPSERREQLTVAHTALALADENVLASVDDECVRPQQRASNG